MAIIAVCGNHCCLW